MVQQGVSHVALTVTDVDASTKWYRQLFGADSVFSDRSEGGDLEVLISGGLMLGLRRHPHTKGDDRFDEGRVGLDHISIHCPSRQEVEGWKDRLEELGIAHSGVEDSPFGVHLNFRDPDNIPLEFFTPAQQG